jgi:hypothetical protein
MKIKQKDFKILENVENNMDEKYKEILSQKEIIQRVSSGAVIGMVVCFVAGIIISSFVWVGILIFFVK